MNTDVYMSWLRTILKVVGSVLASYGYFTNAGQWAMITGFLMALAGAGMSQWEHEDDNGPFTRFLVALGKSLPPPPAACLLILVVASFGLSACSTTSPGASNANVVPVIQSTVQAATTYALTQDPSLKPELQQVLSALQAIQVAEVVVTPAAVQSAVDKVFTSFGSSAAHITYINNLIAPYLQDIATDLPYIAKGLDAALNPPTPTPAPKPAPAAATSTGN